MDLIPALLSIVYVGVCALVTGFFLGQSENGAKSLHLHVGYAVIRRAVNRLSILQLQYVYTIPFVIFWEVALIC